VLYFVSAELALGYWLFAFLSALGALQWVAARYCLGGLSFFDQSRWPQSRHWAYFFSVLLVVGSAAGFFGTQWEAIFAPGPAGSELAVLFATSAVCALVVTVVVAALLQRRRQAYTALDVGTGGEPVAVGHATGYVYAPAGFTTLAPAVCLLPAYPIHGTGRDKPSQAHNGPGSTAAGGWVHSMIPLAHRLVEEGVVVLLIHLDEQSYAYPASLAILPAAVAVLSKRPEVDAGRIGVMGEDLGGDLVIRAASTAKEIKAVVALAPILSDVPAGLDLLREMSYFRALRWARDRKRANLPRELNAAEYGLKISPRPVLLVYGEHDRLGGDPWKLLRLPHPREDGAFVPEEAASTPAVGVEVRVIPGVGHFRLAENPLAWQTIHDWLKEHL